MKENKNTGNGTQVVSAAEHEHTWVVFSTAVADGWIMLQCVDCGLHAVVKDPTKEEWSEAFHAPSRPYEWTESGRLVVQPQVPRNLRYVVRSQASWKCDCYEQRGVLEPRDFERFPTELTRPLITLSRKDRDELANVADIVKDGKLCSHFFDLYLDGCARERGIVHGATVKDVASRISAIDHKGLHCSPAVVARFLLEIASS